MAGNNTTVVQAQQAGSGIDPMVIGAVIGITGLFSLAAYLYFNDRQYNYGSRLISFLGGAIRGDDDTRAFDEEELREEVEEVAEKNEEVKDPDALFDTIEAVAENKEYIGRQEERKKQRKDENLKDILTIVLITSGANLLLRLFEMFA